MRINKLAALIIFLFLILTSWATYEFRGKPDCIFIVNSKYFDYKTNAYQSNKMIEISQGVIKSIEDTPIGPHIDNSCKTVDLEGQFLYPGLIDSHTHLLAADRQKVTGWKAALELSAARPKMMRLFIGAKNAKSMLLAGFTTVRDLGNSGYFLDELLKLEIQRKHVIGPDIITSGPGIAIRPTQIELKHNPQEYAVIDANSDIEKILLDYKSHNVSWIKIYADNSEKDPLISQQLLKILTEKARELHFKIAIHAQYDQSIFHALNARPDSIEHFYEIPHSFDKKAVSRPFAVLTDYSIEACEKSIIEKDCSAKMTSLRARIAWLRANNFNLVFGSDAVLDFTSNFETRGEASLASLISLNRLGLTALEALQAATVNAAEMLNLPIGKIEKDYVGSFVAFSSDPLTKLENVRHIVLVIHRGEIICKGTSECQP